MAFDFAERVKSIPPYLFAEIEEKIAKKRAKGVDVIEFGIGDPDIPTPKLIIDEIKRQLEDPENHRYPTSQGEPDVRKAIADWYRKRFGVELNPDREVCVLLGSKEGLANICRAFVNPGEKVICPDPAYPVYAQGAALLCDAEPVKVQLSASNDFQIDVEDLDPEAKMLFLNYPNNPTGAVASRAYLKRALKWCNDNGVILCYDNAYSEMTFDDYLAPSILEFGRHAVEFGSLSKTFNMTGYRIGYAVGDPILISGLKKIKSQIDSGAPMFIQRAAALALGRYKGKERPPEVQKNVEVYQKRRNIAVKRLRRMGFDVSAPKGTFYLWLPIEGDSMEFADRMLDVGVVVTPGVGFGENGEGFIRLALTQKEERIEEAMDRMQKVL